MQAILELIAARVREIHPLLVTCTPVLHRFRDAYHAGAHGEGWDEPLRYLTQLDKLSDLVSHSIAIGIALTVRRLLREVSTLAACNCTPW